MLTKTKTIKQCVKCGSTTTYVSKDGYEQWRYHDGKTYCNICCDREFRDCSKEIYRHRHCRLCKNEIHKGEYHSELTGKWLCNICKKTLLDNMDWY